MQEKSWKPWALLAPSLTAVFLLLVVPVCFVVVYSFWLRAPSGSDIPAFQFGNYAKFFEDFFYPSLLIRTIRVALETVVLCLVMGYIPAYFFYRTTSKFKPVLMLLIMLPFWISFIIRTLSWINILGDSGLINHVFMKLGIISNMAKEHAEINKRMKRFELFDVITLSCNVGKTKQEKELYLATVQKLGTTSDHCVFVDDKQENLEIAKELGMETIFFQNAEQLASELRELGVNLD